MLRDRLVTVHHHERHSIRTEFAGHDFTHATVTADDEVPAQLFDCLLHGPPPIQTAELTAHHELDECGERVGHGAHSPQDQEDRKDPARGRDLADFPET